MKNLNQYKKVIVNYTKSIFSRNQKLEKDINHIVKLTSTREGYEKLNWSKYYENIQSNIDIIKSKKLFTQEIRKVSLGNLCNGVGKKSTKKNNTRNGNKYPEFVNP